MSNLKLNENDFKIENDIVSLNDSGGSGGG